MLLDKLDYVIAVAEEQNLTRAAQRLFVSQPALTLYLNRLEQELGVKLFDRGKTPVHLTAAGSYYLEHMKKIRTETQSVRQEILDIADPAKTLRVGIGQVRGLHWMPLVLPSFCAAHPHVNINLMQNVESQMAELLLSDKMDLAFGALPPALPGLEILQLFQKPEPLLLAAHRKYGLIPPEEREKYDVRHPFVIQPERLNGLPFIAPAVGNGLYDAYDSIMTGNNIRPSQVITVNNLITGAHLTVCGLGVQMLYSAILQYAYIPDVELLDFCALEKMPANRLCVAAYRASNPKKQLIGDLLDLVRQEVLPLVSF